MLLKTKDQKKWAARKPEILLKTKELCVEPEMYLKTNDLTSNRGPIVHRNAHKSAQLAQNCTFLGRSDHAIEERDFPERLAAQNGRIGGGRKPTNKA